MGLHEAKPIKLTEIRNYREINTLWLFLYSQVYLWLNLPRFATSPPTWNTPQNICMPVFKKSAVMKIQDHIFIPCTTLRVKH